MKSIFRTKSIESIIAGAQKNSLKKTLGSIDLILFGIGCTIGTGIFVLTGIAAAQYAGPAISISYLLAGLACMFAALSYTELAAMVPVAGSAYTYSYAIMGEFVAWLVAWGLILEYTVAASTVAAGWSGYFVGILKSGGIMLPEALTKVPSEGGVINLPAVCVAMFIGLLLTRGTKESIMVNRILVAIKLGVIFLFLIIAAPHIKMENYSNFMPYGWHGVGVGAAAIFFAYLGFDAVATTAEECKNPNRDLPIGIIGGLLICAVLYVAVSLALTGIVNFSELNNSEPMAYALRANGSNIGSALVATGALAGMLAVLLVLMYGQSRIFFVMARDGLMPQAFCQLHKKYGTPYFGCIFVTVAVMAISGFTPIHTMGNMSSLGILFAFVVVSFGVLILRIKRPELKRPFRCPVVFVIAPLAIVSCSYLMYNLLVKTGMPFVIWFAIGILVYAFYGYGKSPLNKE
ncbi:MAG: amino acid permease [Proteobacteria bacterium]|nr:amino acid permease [Pseudomonadota bacterium]